VGGWVGGWVDGWVDGCMDGSKSGFKDCLQQSKIAVFIKNENLAMAFSAWGAKFFSLILVLCCKMMK
jgi:hypothetical protein